MFSTSFCPYLTYRLRPPSHKLYPYTTLFRSIETKKEVIQPAARTINSSGVKLKPKPSSLTKLAPSITGMDMKNENRSEEHTSELQSRGHLVCRLLLEKKRQHKQPNNEDKNK